MPAQKLSIIIVTYNSSFWLKKTLTTLDRFYLSKSTYTPEVIIVDNNSTDDTREILATEFSQYKTMLLDENFGFAYANNRALEQVKSQYAFLLNSDMELAADSNFDRLLTYLDEHPQTAVISPKIIFQAGELDPACHRGEPTLWNSLCYFSGLSALFPQSAIFAEYHQTYKDFDSIHTVDACSGAAMLVRTSLFKKIGLLDEQFFMYAEDLDWCKRFRDAGYNIVYNPQVRIIHHKYKSGIRSKSQKIARQTRKYFYETMLQYYDKHYKDIYPHFVRTILRYVVAIKKGGV